jgi:hypothetical protein
MKDKKIFHTMDEMPEYNTNLIVQYGKQYLPVWNMSYKLTKENIQEHFHRQHVDVLPAVRWCYADDLDKIE